MAKRCPHNFRTHEIAIQNTGSCGCPEPKGVSATQTVSASSPPALAAQPVGPVTERVGVFTPRGSRDVERLFYRSGGWEESKEWTERQGSASYMHFPKEDETVEQVAETVRALFENPKSSDEGRLNCAVVFRNLEEAKAGITAVGKDDRFDGRFVAGQLDRLVTESGADGVMLQRVSGHVNLHILGVSEDFETGDRDVWMAELGAYDATIDARGANHRNAPTPTLSFDFWS
jgi:hypothetical protein